MAAIFKTVIYTNLDAKIRYNGYYWTDDETKDIWDNIINTHLTNVNAGKLPMALDYTYSDATPTAAECITAITNYMQGEYNNQ